MGLFGLGNKPQEQTEVIAIDPSQLGSMGLGVPYPMLRSDKADLLEKIKPNLAVEEARMRLMGYDFINNKWEKVNENYTLSQKGAWELSTLLYSVSNQNVSISFLKDEEIRKRALSITRTAMQMILSHWLDYEIKSTDHIPYIGEIIFSIAFITMKQAQNEGIRALLKGTVQESRNYIDAAPQRKGGVLSKMFGR